ncbi:orotidine-5'-phosphate decarboxylase [Desulfurivibrio alkaliphilus]|uniref:Orotidine 5'-phosphate decarboxylase n=1 Tax=Desulfurivibrio alkaliphilus (strain DSM 19089 / UNIQEM U267 / AHT2) TaxID=589865 RepID=D6Z6A2_DESAT|nr:orotidine-5'-phosphate decarboxylase [Desulfurivibrio alkaliphilus]ADH86867.1 orotidine 5'-phosphate decarboxylase [Desulfurivibrio alkaliphilus AHT 2]
MVSGRQGVVPERRLIFALDVPEPEQAREWVGRLEQQVGFFKVGLELFTAGWWPVVEEIAGRGHGVMLDLKFHDIPETVYRAVRRLRDHGVSLATVHGQESAMLQAAAEAAKGDLQVLAVTVLTSIGEEDLRAAGWAGSAEELVLQRAGKALAAGCAGVVASPREVAALRRQWGEDFLIVTPGIRPAGAAGSDDQQRTATAGAAIAAGADFLVVGRPIRDAADPPAAAAALQQEIAAAL